MKVPSYSNNLYCIFGISWKNRLKIFFFLKKYYYHCSAWLMLKLNTKMGFMEGILKLGVKSLSKLNTLDLSYVYFMLPQNCLLVRNCRRRIQKTFCQSLILKNFLATRLPSYHTFWNSACVCVCVCPQKLFGGTG